MELENFFTNNVHIFLLPVMCFISIFFFASAHILKRKKKAYQTESFIND